MNSARLRETHIFLHVQDAYIFLHSGCFIYPVLCGINKTTIPLKQVKEEVAYKHMVVNTQPMHISKIFQIYLTIISMCLKNMIILNTNILI